MHRELLIEEDALCVEHDNDLVLDGTPHGSDGLGKMDCMSDSQVVESQPSISRSMPMTSNYDEMSDTVVSSLEQQPTCAPNTKCTIL